MCSDPIFASFVYNRDIKDEKSVFNDTLMQNTEELCLQHYVSRLHFSSGKETWKKLCFAILSLNGLGSFLYIRLQLQIFRASLKRGVQLCFFMHSLNWFCIICKWNCSWPWWKKSLSSWSYKEPLQMKPLNWVCIKNGALKEQNGYGTNSMQGCGRVASLSIIEQIESESLSQFVCVLKHPQHFCFISTGMICKWIFYLWPFACLFVWQVTWPINHTISLRLILCRQRDFAGQYKLRFHIYSSGMKFNAINGSSKS